MPSRRDNDGMERMRGGASPLEVARSVVDVLSGKTGGAAAVATVIGRSGSAPQVVGAKLLLHADGRLVGTVGGGSIEERVLAACRETLRDGSPRMIKADLVRDLGMCCGGEMEVFVEHIQPEARVILIGAGHVAQSLAPMCKAAGFGVLVVDDRSELLESPAFSDVECLSHDVDGLDDALPNLGSDDYVVIVTRDHNRDELALASLVHRPHRYLGMIASRRKVHTVIRRILRRNEELGRPPPDLSRVRAPIGLALGGRTPGEIAVSVLAEIIAHRHGGNGEPMSIVEIVDAGSDGPDDPGPRT